MRISHWVSIEMREEEERRESARERERERERGGERELSFHSSYSSSSTAGKLCLQNEDLAKNSLILMSRELQYSKNAAVKNNIVVALCDLAVR